MKLITNYLCKKPFSLYTV